MRQFKDGIVQIGPVLQLVPDLLQITIPPTSLLSIKANTTALLYPSTSSQIDVHFDNSTKRTRTSRDMTSAQQPSQNTHRHRSQTSHMHMPDLRERINNQRVGKIQTSQRHKNSL